MFAPWFGTMRWLLPFFLLVAGWWLEWGPGTRPGSGWGITLLGMSITYVGIVGAAQVLGVSGGRVGRALAGTLTDWFTAPGAFILLVGLAILGIIVGVRDPAAAAHAPGGRHRQVVRGDGRRLDATDRDRRRRRLGRRSRRGGHRRQHPSADERQDGPRGRRRRVRPACGARTRSCAIPAAVPSKGQTSSTFAPARGTGLASATLVAPIRPRA